jgi:protein SCO1/2
MMRFGVFPVICILSVLLLVGDRSEPSHTDGLRLGGAKPPSHEPPAALSPAHQYFSDIILVSQDGEMMRLYSDLLRGKVVVISAFFASCKGSCPIMMATFASLQEWLGERLGTQVHLLSVSVDPQTDTPAKLKAYAEQLKAKPGWYFLTGEKRQVEQALYKLGQYVEYKEDHSNLIIIGNETTGLWKKALGLASTEDIIKVVESVLQDQG